MSFLSYRYSGWRENWTFGKNSHLGSNFVYSVFPLRLAPLLLWHLQRFQSLLSIMWTIHRKLWRVATKFNTKNKSDSPFPLSILFLFLKLFCNWHVFPNKTTFYIKFLSKISFSPLSKVSTLLEHLANLLLCH